MFGSQGYARRRQPQRGTAAAQGLRARASWVGLHRSDAPIILRSIDVPHHRGPRAFRFAG
jgi:hypothetical protein